MKKLMFALVAGVAATVATAAPITTSSFESGEFAAGSSPTNNALFTYASSSSSEDGSIVKAYASAGAPEAPAKDFTGSPSYGYRNGEFTDAGDQFLSLSTDGGTLYRSITAPANSAVVGEARTITKSFYIDTLVQFTVCDSAPDIDNDAKLAIWLQASDDETTTNLMVKAKQWTVVTDDDKVVETVATSTNRVYTLANLNNTPYAAGQWYRLTVEDLGNVFTASGRGATGFKILIDGQPVGAVSGSAFVTTGDADATSVLTGKVGDVAGLTDGSVFMSMADTTIIDNDYTSSLCAVGFSGTGAVDNIMFTEENPFFVAPTAIDFTIALSNVGSVGYSFTTNGYNETGSFTATGGTLEDLPPGTAVTLTPTAKTDELGWNIYGAPVVENAVNAAIDTTEGIVVTLESTFTQGMGDTARVEVNATATPVTKTDAVFSSATWSTPAANLTDEQFAALVAWAGDRSYSTSRVAGYPFALERMATGYDIEMSVFVATNALVVSYDSTIPGTASTDAGTGEPDGAGVMYTVDAGMPFTLSNFTYVAASANKMYKLDGDNASENWKPDPSDEFSQVSGLTIAVDQATSNSVTFTTSVAAATAEVGLGVVEVDVPKIYYTIMFVDGETSTPVQKEAGSTIVAGDIPAFVGQTGYTAAWDDDPLGDEVTGNATYTAVYTINTYTITFVDGASSTPVQKEYGSTIAAGDVPAFIGQTGYTAAWDDDPVGDEVTGDATYTAVYTINTYTVTFNKNNESATGTMSDQTFTYNVAQALTANAFALDGYTFAGWATAADGEKVYDDEASLTLTAGLTLYAKWEQNAPAVVPIEPYAGGEATYADDAAATAAAAAINADKTTNIPLPASIKDGLSPEQKNAYYASVEAVADGTKVTVEFTSAGETAAQTSADTAATAVAAELGKVAASVSGDSANIATVPGFYYSILYKASLDASWTEQLPRVLGTGSAVPITVPKVGTAGFYQLKVSPVGKAE